MIKIGEERCRIIGMYVNGDIREKWEGIREWVEEKGLEIRTIVGGTSTQGRGNWGDGGRVGWKEGKREGEGRGIER